MRRAPIPRSAELSLDDLWNSALHNAPAFSYARVSTLPEGARLYLTHAIAAGTPLASAVRLRMHGEIKLKNWCRFSADEVISWGNGMVWRAVVRMHGLPIRGSDRLVEGIYKRAALSSGSQKLGPDRHLDDAIPALSE